MQTDAHASLNSCHGYSRCLQHVYGAYHPPLYESESDKRNKPKSTTAILCALFRICPSCPFPGDPSVVVPERGADEDGQTWGVTYEDYESSELIKSLSFRGEKLPSRY